MPKRRIASIVREEIEKEIRRAAYGKASLIREGYTNQYGEEEELLEIYYSKNPFDEEEDYEPTYHVYAFQTMDSNFSNWGTDYTYGELARKFGQDVADDIEEGAGEDKVFGRNLIPCKFIDYDESNAIDIHDVNQVNAMAKKYFTVVGDISEADYILTDGTLLSVGRNAGKDHNNISFVAGDKHNFINLGNIRINSCGYVSIDCLKMPTRPQIMRLKQLLDADRITEPVIVECDGKNAEYYPYECGEIIDDIILYFNKGIWAKDRGQSGIGRFR